jgi:hypothetical protein
MDIHPDWFVGPWAEAAIEAEISGDDVLVSIQVEVRYKERLPPSLERAYPLANE